MLNERQSGDEGYSSRVTEFIDRALNGSPDDPHALLKRIPVAFGFGLLTPLMVRHGLPDAVAYARGAN